MIVTIGLVDEVFTLAHFLLYVRFSPFGPIVQMSQSPQCPSVEPTLPATREWSLDFLDDRDLSWVLSPEDQLVTFMGHLRISEGPRGAPTRVITEHNTLHFRLPWAWMWTAYWEPHNARPTPGVVGDSP